MVSKLVAATVATVLVLGAGCRTNMGPTTISPARFDYNQAIAASWNEQLLLNLVRLRYRDTVHFLEVSSVITQYSLEQHASASAGAVFNGSTVGDVGLGAGINYSEEPTVTFTPMNDATFAQRLLAPIPAETLIQLAQSGWSTEQLMLCCVQQVNNLQNARSASSRAPYYVPHFEEFHRAAQLMRQLQGAGIIDMRLVKAPDDTDTTVLYLEQQPTGEWADEVAEVWRLFGLAPGRRSYRITSRLSGAPDEIAIIGRSLSGVLYFLSQAVKAPPEDELAGKVAVTRDQSGQAVDWNQVTGNILNIYSQKEPPPDAFVRVFYRDHWFYIADNDLESKTTFGLVSYLFSLQAAGVEGKSPLLTVSAGR
jgi:hypothetical protein